MLSSLTLKNFKPFENQSFSLKPLTLLTGLNSTGKSSVLQSLLLLRQSCLQDELLDRVGLVLNGDLVSIGTGQDALFKRAKQDLITLEIVMDNDNDIKGTWIFDCDRQSDIMRLSPIMKLSPDLALAASCGIQIIVETHSDHVLNGIRKAVKYKKLDPEKVQINYFERYLKKGEPTIEIITPQIYSDGGIDKWPDG